MAWRRKYRPEIYPVDPRVPAFESWPAEGISGVIGLGPHAGLPVLARQMHLRGRGLRTAYVLWLPEEELTGEDDFHLEADAIGTFHSDGTGGLIDYLTGGLGVNWSTDVADFASAARYWPNSENWPVDPTKQEPVTWWRRLGRRK